MAQRTALVRSTASRTSHGQALASNVDAVVVTVSLAAPLKHGRTERMLALGGVLVVTEIEWTVPDPAAPVRAYRDAAYPLRTHAANTDAAQAAGYRLRAHRPLPESDRWDQ